MQYRLTSCLRPAGIFIGRWAQREGDMAAGGMGDDVAGIDGADGVEGERGSGVSTRCTFGWLALSIPTRSRTTE